MRIAELFERSKKQHSAHTIFHYLQGDLDADVPPLVACDDSSIARDEIVSESSFHGSRDAHSMVDRPPQVDFSRRAVLFSPAEKACPSHALPTSETLSSLSLTALSCPSPSLSSRSLRSLSTQNLLTPDKNDLGQRIECGPSCHEVARQKTHPVIQQALARMRRMEDASDKIKLDEEMVEDMKQKGKSWRVQGSNRSHQSLHLKSSLKNLHLPKSPLSVIEKETTTPTAAAKQRHTGNSRRRTRVRWH